LTGVYGGQGRDNTAGIGAYDRRLPPKTPPQISLVADTLQGLFGITNQGCFGSLFNKEYGITLVYS